MLVPAGMCFPWYGPVIKGWSIGDLNVKYQPPPPKIPNYSPGRIWSDTGANALFSAPRLLKATEDMCFSSYFIFKTVCIFSIAHGSEAEREPGDQPWVPEAAERIQVYLKVTSPPWDASVIAPNLQIQTPHGKLQRRAPWLYHRSLL